MLDIYKVGALFCTILLVQCECELFCIYMWFCKCLILRVLLMFLHCFCFVYFWTVIFRCKLNCKMLVCLSPFAKEKHNDTTCIIVLLLVGDSKCIYKLIKAFTSNTHAQWNPAWRQWKAKAKRDYDIIENYISVH